MAFDDGDETAPDTDTDTDVEEGEGNETPAAGAEGGGGGEVADADILTTFSQEEWAQELVRDQVEKGKPYAMTKAEVDALPIEAKRAMASLVRRGQLAEADLVAQKASMAKAKEDAEAAEARALRAQADALTWAQAPGLQAFLEKLKPKGDQPDPSSPEGIEWMVSKGVGEKLGEFFAALQGEKKTRDDADAAAVAARAEEKKRNEIAAYMDEHPDDFVEGTPTWNAIRALYQAAKGGLTIQQAHKAVMAQAIEDELGKTHADDLKAARARVQKGGSRGKVIPEMPKEVRGNSELELEWYDAHPDAMQRDIDRHLRTQSR